MLEVLAETADAVATALRVQQEWGLAGTRHGQYHHDLTADAAALAVLGRAGVAVLSEESGVSHDGHAVTVVVDPVDGSTNASRALPWWATSLCAVDGDGPWVALVVDQVSGVRWHAIRGGGAFRNGVAFRRSETPPLREAMIGLGGWPPFHFGWYQYRSLGAIALDLCAVADGRLDGYAHCVPDQVAEWDYAGGLLICRESGAQVVDVHGRELIVLDHDARRTPVAAGNVALLNELLDARRRFA
jgi:myo-inositol-1(or 4)-monophosphatase